MREIFYVCFVMLFCCFIKVNAQEKDNILKNYMDNYQYKEALSYIEKQEPTFSLLIDKAHCYEKLNDYRRSIEILLPLSKEYGDDRNIKVKLASCYQSLFDWNRSLDCYEDLIKLDSTISYYKIQKADMLFYLNRYEEALLQYKSLFHDNQLISAVGRSAQCFENMNLLDSAIVYYNRAYEIDSADNSSLASLINLYIKTEKKENYLKAINLSDTYLEKDTTNKRINLLNGLSYYASDLYEESAKRFNKCFLNGDTSLIVNRTLGISYYLLGENIKAYPYLSKAYEQDTTNTNIIYALAVVCNETSKPEQATKYFQSLLNRIIPADITLYLYYKGLATGQESLQNNLSAAESYKKAIQYAGENQQMYLYFSLAALYDYDLNKPIEALEYYIKYKDSLSNYLKSIKEREYKLDIDISTIEDTEFKLKNLETHIQRLRKQINN